MFGCLPARRKSAFRGTVECRSTMQKRARCSVRNFGLLALATIAGPVACSQAGPFSDDEMTKLRQFSLPPAPPEDPSNWVADSPDAARLGKQLYFDPRYAGALLPPYNAV